VAVVELGIKPVSTVVLVVAVVDLITLAVQEQQIKDLVEEHQQPLVRTEVVAVVVMVR
jgi:hypothetical protein